MAWNAITSYSDPLEPTTRIDQSKSSTTGAEIPGRGEARRAARSRASRSRAPFCGTIFGISTKTDQRLFSNYYWSTANGSETLYTITLRIQIRKPFWNHEHEFWYSSKTFSDFLKNQNTAAKYSPICDMESAKFYRNRWVRAELAETFTIDVVLFTRCSKWSKAPHLNFSGAEKSGYFEKKKTVTLRTNNRLA